MDLKSRVGSSHFSELNQKSLKVDSDLAVKLLVSDFVNLNSDSNSNTQCLLLANFVDVLNALNNLRHNDDLFDNLLQNIWDLNDFLDAAENWDHSFLKSVDDLHFGFYVVLDVSFLDEVVLLDNFILIDDNLFDLGESLFNGNDFLFNCHDFSNLLMNNWNLNGSVPEGFNDLVDFNDDWVIDS